MKLYIIRHADPDYEKDSLTEVGFKEAKALAERMKNVPAKEYYVSTMGRALRTSEPTLEAVGREAIKCDWLREFSTLIHRPDTDQMKICWDWLPADWEKDPRFYDKDLWMSNERMMEAHIDEDYKKVCDELDKLLETHGYKRNGLYYDAVKPNNDTLVFFCHFGLECVLLSHLINVSPMILWHGFCSAPTGVTIVRTQERRPGIADFRVSNFSDTSHLYAQGMEESFSARFCECFTNEEERHD